MVPPLSPFAAFDGKMTARMDRRWLLRRHRLSASRRPYASTLPEGRDL